MTTKNSDSDNSTSITVNAGEIVKAHSTLMVKRDLNQNGNSTGADDRAVMKDAFMGTIELL